MKYPLFCATLMKLEFSQHIFGKPPRTSNFAKIRPVGVKLSQADTSCYLRTDKHDTTNNTTCNFANVPEAVTLSQCLSIPLCYLAIFS